MAAAAAGERLVTRHVPEAARLAGVGDLEVRHNPRDIPEGERSSSVEHCRVGHPAENRGGEILGISSNPGQVLVAGDCEACCRTP